MLFSHAIQASARAAAFVASTVAQFAVTESLHIASSALRVSLVSLSLRLMEAFEACQMMFRLVIYALF